MSVTRVTVNMSTVTDTKLPPLWTQEVPSSQQGHHSVWEYDVENEGLECPTVVYEEGKYTAHKAYMKDPRTTVWSTVESAMAAALGYVWRKNFDTGLYGLYELHYRHDALGSFYFEPAVLYFALHQGPHLPDDRKTEATNPLPPKLVSNHTEQEFTKSIQIRDHSVKTQTFDEDVQEPTVAVPKSILIRIFRDRASEEEIDAALINGVSDKTLLEFLEDFA